MLVRFIKSGPVRHGPASIHGLPGQIADLDGDDLQAAIEAGMVEMINPDPLDHDENGRKGGSKPRKAKA